MIAENFEAFCPTCKKLGPAEISGSTSITSNGCDSCGYGSSVYIEITIKCPAGHQLWHVDGDAAGIL